MKQIRMVINNYVVLWEILIIFIYNYNIFLVEYITKLIINLNYLYIIYYYMFL